VTSTRRTPAVFFELLKIECFMFGIFQKTAIHRVAGVAYGYFPYKIVCEKVHHRRQAQRQHGRQWLTFCKKIETRCNAEHHDGHAGITIEILLDVQVLMAA
jgi:hypothetical protein